MAVNEISQFDKVWTEFITMLSSPFELWLQSEIICHMMCDHNCINKKKKIQIEGCAVKPIIGKTNSSIAV